MATSKTTFDDLSDEVLIPALTFVATANAVSYCGAIPHFVDSNFKNSPKMDLSQAENIVTRLINIPSSVFL
jgi:dTDP-4-amino-4,6-dideoxygalactose transaminase